MEHSWNTGKMRGKDEFEDVVDKLQASTALEPNLQQSTEMPV